MSNISKIKEALRDVHIVASYKRGSTSEPGIVARFEIDPKQYSPLMDKNIYNDLIGVIQCEVLKKVGEGHTIEITRFEKSKINSSKKVEINMTIFYKLIS